MRKIENRYQPILMAFSIGTKSVNKIQFCGQTQMNNLSLKACMYRLCLFPLSLLSPYWLLWFYVLDTMRMFPPSFLPLLMLVFSWCLSQHGSLWVAGAVARVSDVVWEMKSDWPGSASLFLLTHHLIWSSVITQISLAVCYCWLKGMRTFSEC